MLGLGLTVEFFERFAAFPNRPTDPVIRADNDLDRLLRKRAQPARRGPRKSGRNAKAESSGGTTHDRAQKLFRVAHSSLVPPNVWPFPSRRCPFQSHGLPSGRAMPPEAFVPAQNVGVSMPVTNPLERMVSSVPSADA